MTDFRTPVPFGQTGLHVSRLGIGSSFTRDAAFIEEAVDQGVNYLYWGSIRRPAFGRAIKNVARNNREGVVLTPDQRLKSIERSDAKLKVVLCNEYSDETSEREVDQVVIECGTLAMDDVYFELLESSRNHGEYDLDAFVLCQLRPIDRNPEGSFNLYRIGDAVASRNIHAAMFDAIRIASQL